MSDFNLGGMVDSVLQQVGVSRKSGAAGGGDVQAGGTGGPMGGAQPIQPAQSQAQGLPPTGLQQQMASLNDLYDQVQNAQTSMGGIGFDVRQMQFDRAQAGGGGELQADMPMGSTSIDQMARNMAQRYGMPIGRGRLVDEQGNFLMTPQQVADASGGAMTLGEAAANMNYISQAITARQNEQQQQKGIAALQTGMGQVQSRGRGSLATLQMGLYEGLADMYSNMEYEAADFSYFIQKEQQEIQMELMRRAEELQERQSRAAMFTGIGMGVGGLLTGNVGMALGGAGMAAGGAAGSGWF